MSLAQGNGADYYGGGTGELNDPYQIWTPDQFVAIGAHSGDWASHFRLMADVNLVDAESALIAPIGNHVVPFSGVFDGNGFAIEEFVLDHASLNDVGVFGVVGIPELKARIDPDGLGERYVFDYQSHVFDPNEMVIHIRNVRLVNVRISGSKHVGALAGRCFGGIENCRIEGGTLAFPEQDLGGTYSGAVPKYFYDSQFSVREYSLRKGSAGGVVGHLLVGKLVGCDASSVEISGERLAGGLVGFCDESIIEGCSFKGNVTSGNFGGGLVGNTQLSKVRKSRADADVIGRYRNGGLFGIASGSRISQCRATGQVQGSDTLGGLIGYSYGSRISDCYAQCDLTPLSDRGGTGMLNEMGGFLGTSVHDSIARCYCASRLFVDAIIDRWENTGNIKLRHRGGSFIGKRTFNDFERQLTRASFWDEDVSVLSIGVSYVMSYTNNYYPIEQISPISTPEMMSQVPFMNAGWNFETIWAIEEGGATLCFNGSLKSDQEML